jgi:molybdate transport system substrate-binding protein
MKRIFLVMLMMLALVSASAQKVNVAAAANLRDVLEEIKTAYLKSHPKAVLNLTFGSSGTLVQQIANGASFDFFMSADNEFPLKLKDKGLTVGAMTTYAFGKLALYSTSVNVEKKGLDALKDPSVQKIAIANPTTAPYGERSLALLKSKGYYEEVKGKLVYGENISQAAQYAFTGNAELGFVALSLALAPEMKGKGYCYVVPANLYEPVEQACILIKRSVLNTEANKFRAYVLSVATKPIWEKYGYTVPTIKKK